MTTTPTAGNDPLADAAGMPEAPVTLRDISIRPATVADLKAALGAGLADFVRAPLFGLFFGGIYAVGGLLIAYGLAVAESIWLVVPAAVGFPLLGPFVAVGLYEVSRRRAAGEPLDWKGVLTVVVRQRHGQLGWMAFVTLFIFWIWMYQVRLLLALFLASQSFSSLEGFLAVVTGTGDGLAFLAVGTIVGAFLSTVLYSITVIAMPLLLDRDPDVVTAIVASVKTVFASPVVMLGWGAFVAALVILAMLPAFLGLLVVLPVLGHATWHLYARLVTVRR